MGAKLKDAILEQAKRLQAERAAAKAKHPRQRRDTDAPIGDGWRTLPKAHSKYDGELGFILDGKVYATRRGPAEHWPDGTTSYTLMTLCLGLAKDIWPAKVLQSENPPHDTPQCPEDGISQIVTKGDDVCPRGIYHFDTVTLKNLASDGLSTREIAERLGVSHMTVARRLKEIGEASAEHPPR